jgi:hypothetical protein
LSSKPIKVFLPKHVSDFESILNDPLIQAVVISTPAATHYALVKQALKAGKAMTGFQKAAVVGTRALKVLGLAFAAFAATEL